MNIARELLRGILSAGLILLVVVGALIISQVEQTAVPAAATDTGEMPFDFPTGLAILKTPTPAQANPTVTATIACAKPTGWLEYTVQAADTLAKLAARAAITQGQLREGNCLLSDELVAGTLLYLPPIEATRTPLPALTETPVQCGPPIGWIKYRIQAQDTLFRISLNYGVSVPQLQFANCMGNSTFLRTGEFIYVPNVATRTPDFTPTPTGTNIPAPTSTPETETVEPTATSDPTVTSTETGYPAP